MVEAGSPEVLPQPLIEALLVAKDDSQQDSASLAVEFTRHRVCKPASQAIAEASEAAAMSGQSPAVTGQHDVDAVASEPGSLVEAVTRPAGKLRFGAHLEDAALRGCPAKRQLELSRLVERDEAEPPDAHRHLQVESSPARCRRDDDECSLGAPDFGAQGAVIETLEPCASPPPARHDEQAGDRPDGTPGARGEADRRRASLVPEPAGLHKVVDMLGEADLVDPALGGRLDEYLHRLERMVDPLLGIAKVHVVVDDQSNEATNSRSAASVTFTSLESPGTVVTRPPRASTSEAQSVAPASSPATASRSTGARNACGVWTATSSSRGSVSTICPPRTRLTVSASGNAGTAPSQPSFSAVSTRPITSSGSTGRAASWTTITAASPPTSATPARTDSARASPPPTQALTFAQPSSSATRIEGSSQPGGATITISSIQSEASRRSRLSARSGRSRSFANAFGRSEPSRSPRPAAARTAQTLNGRPMVAPPLDSPSAELIRPQRQSRHGLYRHRKRRRVYLRGRR